MAMDRAQAASAARRFDAAIARAREWIVGMQSQNGGWGAFDADNDYHYLNNIPVRRPRRAARSADRGRHRALRLDAGAARRDRRDERRRWRARSTICARRSMPDGSWYGRWGMNYIYGTWSVLCALNAAGVDHRRAEMRKAVDWLVAIQNADGGWGEDGASYKLDYRGYEPAPSTASQTAWALLGLMAAGEIDHPAVGARHRLPLRDARRRRLLGRGALHRDRFPARVLSALSRLREFFPLWAMARYRNLKRGNTRAVTYGM